MQKSNNSKTCLSRALIESAVDFLHKSIEEIETSPKYSLIHFCIGVELMLKAGLVYLDWKYILIDPYLTTEEEFNAGDFRSVSPNDLFRRINKLTKDNITHEGENSFKKLFRHRNKIIHFVHNDFTGSEKLNIINEQWVSWYYLHNLLTSKKNEAFSACKEEISEINNCMQYYKKYQMEKFQLIKNNKADNEKYLQCNICKLEALVITEEKTYGAECACKVCETEISITRSVDIVINCPKCKAEVYVSKTGNEVARHIGLQPTPLPVHKLQPGFSFVATIYQDKVTENECQKCGHAITNEEVISGCELLYNSEDCDDYHEGMPNAAYCCLCGGDAPTVFYINQEWICVLCHERGWTALSCPHCSEFVYGDAQNIQYCFCVRCEEDFRQKNEGKSNL